ncbi:MAG: HU family DNA-binding protein, partial [Methylophilaceae bacterium]
MTRSELIEKLSSQFQHLLQKDAELVVKNILDSMSDTLNNGKRSEISG